MTVASAGPLASLMIISLSLMKLFKTSKPNNVKYCQERFSFDTPSDLWRERATKLESKFTDFYVKV